MSNPTAKSEPGNTSNPLTGSEPREESDLEKLKTTILLANHQNMEAHMPKLDSVKAIRRLDVF
ncbi:hypothetical protein ES705_39630 [subsurface metagenome]